MESGDIEKSATPSEPPPGPDPVIGTTIGERYRVLRLLGRGGMAAVYKGEHELLKKPVAIKLILPQLTEDADMLRRFEREATLAGKLDHPNCVSVTDFGRTAGGRFFLVMEYLEGIALADLLFEKGRLPPARAIDYTRQILRGLGRAHELGILHRDLKTTNVMLVKRDGGREIVKIIDFGIARAMGDPNNTQNFKTEAGLVFGTADYLAPERLTAQPNNDARCDIYSVGVMLYEMLTGERPFHAEEAIEIVQRALKEQPMPPRTRAPDAGISPELEQVVLKALEKDPARRFSDAKAMLAALDGADDVIDVLELSEPSLGDNEPPPAVKQPTPPGPPTAAASARALAAAREQGNGGGRGAVPRPLPTAVRRRFSRMAWTWLIAAPVVVITLALVIGLGGGGGGKHGTPRTPAVGPGATEDIAALAQTASNGETPAVREAAYQRLLALGHRDKVDFVAKLTRDLAQGESCVARKKAVEALGRLGDARALPALQAARQAPDNECLLAAADIAITRLGSGSPANKKPGTSKSKPVKSNADRF